MSGRVLVVDDDTAIREFVALALQDEGYAVATAADGREALERCAAFGPDLVLLDLNMPGLDGWQTRARLRETAPRLPVVFMTAGQHAASEAARHDAAGALPKPFDLDQLLALVARFAA